MSNGKYMIVSADGFNLLDDDGKPVQYITVDRNGSMEGYYSSLQEVEEVHGPINLPEEGTTKQIKVKAIEEFEVYNHDQSILLNRVYEGEEFEATFDEECGEYHSNDSEGRELYIGTIDINGNLELDESFVLLGPEEGTTE